jgi:hypothetical protein
MKNLALLQAPTQFFVNGLEIVVGKRVEDPPGERAFVNDGRQGLVPGT